jgi:hypothetical protein
MALSHYRVVVNGGAQRATLQIDQRHDHPDHTYDPRNIQRCRGDSPVPPNVDLQLQRAER